MKRISRKNNETTQLHYYSGQPHGPYFITHKDSITEKTDFFNRGVRTDPYDGWEKRIYEYDQIPALEKQLDSTLQKYGIMLDDTQTSGNGKKVIITKGKN